MMQHSKYWSCTKVADWLRGAPKPPAATAEGWDEWRKQMKAERPIRYWIAEEGLDHIQDFIFYPKKILMDIKYYLNNRYVTKTHAITSNMKRGQWYEFDSRILNCLFDELVNFVEVEVAWNHTMWDEEARKKYNAPFWAHGFFRTRTWRCPQAGLDWFHWAATLTKKEYLPEGDPKADQPSAQAVYAKEVLELYDWWKNVHPKRPDPYVVSGWTAYCEECRTEGISLSSDKRDKKRINKMLNEMKKIEEAYDKEDTAMLVRLIKIRKHLWT